MARTETDLRTDGSGNVSEDHIARPKDADVDLDRN